MRELWSWSRLSLLISAIMLIGVGVVAGLRPGDGESAQFNALTRQGDLEDVWYVFTRNLLVLGIHLGACLIGAIIGRRYTPLSEKYKRFNFLHRELPAWVAKGAMLYALVVTISSIVTQTFTSGQIISDLASYLGVSAWQVVVGLLPHALPELTGIFLPLALFLIKARAEQLEELGRLVWVCCLYSLLMLAAASFVEAYFSPWWINTVAYSLGDIGDIIQNLTWRLFE